MPESVEAALLVAARAGDPQAFGSVTEPYRRELLVHCYRILGSLQDAEDVVQETLLRAWRRLNTFEGRASFRAWLYKIATNVCLDMLDKQARRVLPTATHPPADPREPIAPPITEPIWLEPFPDEWLVDAAEGPEARYAAHESITLAFLMALQLLPPRQRVVLLMRDVLAWRANEVAELLDLTVPAVNSALHRARATLAKHHLAKSQRYANLRPADETVRVLLDRYVRAWESADVPGLVALLKEDAAFAMPPSPTWYRGRDAVAAMAAVVIFAGDSRGRWRLVPTRANAQPAFALYQRAESGGVHRAFALQVLTVSSGQLAEVHTFMNPNLLPRFGLPAELPA